MKSFIRNMVLMVILSLVSVAAFAQKVDINTASATEIAEALVGVGTSKAEAIVAYRKEHGPFKTADDLVLVKGIGEKTVAKNYDSIVIRQETKK